MTFSHVHKKGHTGPPNYFVVVKNCVLAQFGTHFGTFGADFFCIFSKHLIVLSDRDVARKGKIHKYLAKI